MYKSYETYDDLDNTTLKKLNQVRDDDDLERDYDDIENTLISVIERELKLISDASENLTSFYDYNSKINVINWFNVGRKRIIKEYYALLRAKKRKAKLSKL